MKEKIRNVDQAIKFIIRRLNMSIDDVSKYKWRVYDEEVDFSVTSDKELIDYAKEQQEAIDEVEE